MWRGPFDNAEVNALHAEAFHHDPFEDDWVALTQAHSMGWVTARHDGRLVGFANVIWDGLVHAWLQDVIVAESERRTGVGLALVVVARDQAKHAGCEWLHVDFDEDLAPFYLGAAGFTRTAAGLINLSESD